MIHAMLVERPRCRLRPTSLDRRSDPVDPREMVGSRASGPPYPLVWVGRSRVISYTRLAARGPSSYLRGITSTC
jgi:hypothetical protein